MNINYTWKHLDRSEAAETYCDEKMDRTTKFVHKIVSCEISFETIHGEIHANMKLHADSTFFNAHNTNKDIYACIDGLEDKILAQVSKHHDKMSKH
ncbi:MAG: ribosome-associated translation inhibitor RaiA [Leptospira sp.]|nr:ribosome-associated translation inhibitor RaiA [Leptospira sp.]